MVGVQDTMAAVYLANEVSNGLLSRQKFPTKSGPSLLFGRQVLAEIAHWFPMAVLELLENGPNAGLGGVGGQGEWQGRVRMSQVCS